MERHARVKRLYLECCELEGEERARHLAREGAKDAELLHQVEAMLDFDRRRPAFLNASAAQGEEKVRTEGCAPEPLPRTIGRFRVRRLIGTGGMGTVFEVEQDRPPRNVALKLLRSEAAQPRELRRFELEAELLGRLQHVSIARIYESGSVATDLGSRPYLLMELVRGVPLTHHVLERASSLRERLELVASVCDAVQYAHENGVVHRDLKPANILVEDSGLVKVLDFGIARALDDPRSTSLRTHEGEVVGTLAYMSPEQASGTPVDARTDVYSLGVLLYELLTDRLPHEVASTSLPQALEAIREEAPRRISAVVPALRGDVETIVARALEKAPERRYPSAADLAADLRRFLRDEPIHARPASRIYTLRKFVRRNRPLVGGTVGVILALAAGLVSSVRFGRAEAAERARAEGLADEARAQAYRSGILAAQLAYEAGNWPDASQILESLPRERRGWEWNALANHLERALGECVVPGLFDAAYLDERRVLAVDQHGLAWIWDTVLETLSGPEPIAPGARPVALSGDGLRLVSYAEGELIASSTRGDGSALRVPFSMGESGSETRAVLSPDADRLALVTGDRALYVIDLAVAPLERGPRVRRLGEEALVHRNLRFSGDGRLLACAVSAAVRLWDLEQGTERWIRRKKRTKFDALAFDPQHEVLALGHDSAVWFHGLDDGEVGSSWSGQKLGTLRLGSPEQLEYDRSGTRLAALFKRGAIRLLDAETGSHLATVENPGGGPQSRIAFAPDEQSFLSVGREDDTLRLWNASTEPGLVLGGNDLSIYPLVVAPDGSRIATAGWDGKSRLWDATTGEELAALESKGRIWALAFAPDSRALACGLRERGLVLWDTHSGQLRARLEEVRAASLAYSPDGTRLAVGDMDGHVQILEASRLGVLASIPVAEKRVSCVAWTLDGRWLAAGTLGGNLVLLDSGSRTEIARTKGSRTGSFGDKGLLTLAFAPDGKRLATGWGSSEVILWDVPGLSAPHVLVGHQEEVFSVAFSPDGRRLVSGGRDGILRLWDPERGGLLLSLKGHRSYIYSLAFTPDGRRIATGSGDGTIRLWDSAPADVGWRERMLAERTGWASPLVSESPAAPRSP